MHLAQVGILATVLVGLAGCGGGAVSAGPATPGAEHAFGFRVMAPAGKASPVPL